MKQLTVLALILLFVSLFGSGLARSEPICGYTASDGELKVLKYWPHSKEGEEYVDFGTGGTCIKKVTCQADYTMKFDECKDVKITCQNKNLYSDGVFPKCCIKC